LQPAKRLTVFSGVKKWFDRIDPPVRPKILLALCAAGAIAGALLVRSAPMWGAVAGAVIAFSFYFAPPDAD
jgi:hypothetical protein